MLQDLLPIRRVVITTKVRLQLAAEDLQCRTLANTVRSNQTQDLTRTRHGKSVELEAIGRITVGDLSLQVGGQVDDVNRTERALLRADTTTNAQSLGDEGDLGLGGDLDAKFASANHRARLFAFLTTFLLQLASARHHNLHKICTFGLHCIRWWFHVSQA